MVSVLFARPDSLYKTIDGLDVYDKDRDAKTWTKSGVVIAHPPCRAWGVLSHMAKPEPGEAELAEWALYTVRKYGGVLEHPEGSRLWSKFGIPDYWELFTDCSGGFSLLIDQFDFGHVASKPTRIYVCGCRKEDVPDLPTRDGKPMKSITGQVPGTSRCTQYEREYTPIDLARWLVGLAERCEKNERVY